MLQYCHSINVDSDKSDEVDPPSDSASDGAIDEDGPSSQKIPGDRAIEGRACDRCTVVSPYYVV